MASSFELRQLGLRSHQANDLDSARERYLQVLQLDPLDADAWHLLGIVAHQQCRQDEAAELIIKAIDLAPNRADFYSNLAEVRRAQGDYKQAVAHCQTAIRLAPQSSGAYNNLALASLGLGQLSESITACLAGLAISPDSVELWNSLGEANRVAGNWEQAGRCFRRAVAINPSLAAAHLNLGNVLRATRRFDEAAGCLQMALRLRPEYAKAYSNLAVLCLDQQRLQEAEYHASEALRLDPNLPEAHCNMSSLKHYEGELTAALEHAHRALQLSPDLAEAHNNLASILQDRGCVDEALQHFAAAWHSPFAATPWTFHSNYLFGMNYRAGTTPEQLLAAHRDWNQRYATPLATQSPPPIYNRGVGRPLRLGLVSADLGCHPVGQFVSAWLPELDPERMQVHCYSDRPIEDELAQRLKPHATTWRNVSPLDDDALATTIRDDRIDLLFDLAGHTRQNRLLVFARRPAPIQATWIGYVGTTGLETMDCLLADRYLIPPGDECYYRERVLRLPDGWLCYAPPAQVPAVSPPPCLARGYVTFGCFNNPAKITPPVVAAWSEILRRVPDSRLLLKFKWFDDSGTREHFRKLFARQGIEAARVEMKGWSSQVEHLACYQDVDLALDTFPYSGGITTCEALWMGVPVIALVGRIFAARQSYSHLMNAGLAELTTWATEEFIECAVAWGTNYDRLTAYRFQLRQQVNQSPLCDGPRFARHLECLLTDLCAIK